MQIEEQIDLNTLEELKKAFLRADRDESGQLDLEEFKALLKARLNLRVTKVSIPYTGVTLKKKLCCCLLFVERKGYTYLEMRLIMLP